MSSSLIFLRDVFWAWCWKKTYGKTEMEMSNLKIMQMMILNFNDLLLKWGNEEDTDKI